MVDFWAPWCVPCRTTKPVLEKLGMEFSGDVEFLPVNADMARDVLQNYRVFGIPTVIAIRNGREIARLTGLQNEARYRSMFDALAQKKEVRVPMTRFDRSLRLGAGGAFLLIGVSNGSWLVAGIGALLAFLGIHDRCPLWRAITGSFRRM